MAFGSSDAQILTLVIEAQDHATEKIKAVGESLARLSEYVIGYEIVRGAIDGIKELGAGVIETNAVMQQLQQTFTAIYHSASEAQQAVDWITQFGMSAPFTTQSIMQAGVAIASIGQDITQVLPALGNLAAVMNVDMPTAAQALVDAFEGRFQMMQRDLHVTKEELQGFGLQVEANGHVVQSTLIPAFEAFVAKNYPQGMKLQMDTLHGVWSNFVDQFQLVEREIGKQPFKALQADLTGVTTWLQQNQGTVAAFAATLSETLGGALTAVGGAVGDLMTTLPPLVAGFQVGWDALSTVVDRAAGIIHGAVADIGDFLQQYVLPVVYQALGTLIGWWKQHGADISKTLSDLWANIQQFAKTAGALLVGAWTVIKDVAGVAWGAIEVIIGTSMENIDGNSRRWREMQVDGWTQMQVNILGIIGEMTKGAISLVTSKQIDDAFYSFSSMLAGLIYEPFHLVLEGIALALNGAEALINQFTARLAAVKISVPTGPFGPPITIAPFGGLQQLTYDFTKDANDPRRKQAFEDILGSPHAIAEDVRRAIPVDALRANIDANVKDAQNAVMQMNGFIKEMKTIHTLAGDKQIWTGNWLRPADGSTAPGFQYSGGGAQAVGQAAIDTMVAEWQKALDAKFKALDITTKGLGPLPGPGGLPGYLSGGAAQQDQALAKAAQDRALKDARDQFQLDMAAGHYGAARGDIATILKDMTPLLGFDAQDRAVENNTLLKEIAAATKQTTPKTAQERALKDAQAQFQIDLNNSHFTAATKDIATILADMTPLLGFDTKDRELERQNLLKEIAAATKGTHAALGSAAAQPSPLSGYRLPREASFGAAIISFAEVGQASQQEILRQAVAQITALQQQVASLQQQVAAQEEQNTLLREGNAHGATTAQATTQTARVLTSPAPSVAGRLRAGGVLISAR